MTTIAMSIIKRVLKIREIPLLLLISATTITNVHHQLYITEIMLTKTITATIVTVIEKVIPTKKVVEVMILVVVIIKTMMIQNQKR